MGLLLDHSWPGNTRELHNVLERTVVLNVGRVIERVDLLDLPNDKCPINNRDVLNQ